MAFLSLFGVLYECVGKNLERCFLVVSTDGTFPTNLDPTTTANPAEGIYEIFPDLSINGFIKRLMYLIAKPLRYFSPITLWLFS